MERLLEKSFLPNNLAHPRRKASEFITYIKSRELTHYLPLVTDAYSRKIMGYHRSDDMSAEHVIKALRRAVKNRKNNK